MKIKGLLLAVTVSMAGVGLCCRPLTMADRQWTLATQDTSLQVGLDNQGKPAIFALINPSQQFNWTQHPSPIPLPNRVVYNGQSVAPDWQFQGATVDSLLGTKLTLRFMSAAPGLRITLEWWARPGAGPIHVASFITNSSGGPVGIFYQPTLALQLTTPQTEPLQAWHFATDGGTPDPQGVFREQVAGNFSGIVHTDPVIGTGSIPLAVLDAGGHHGLYVGTEWSYGDIKITGSSSNPHGATVQSGNVTTFQTTLQAGQVFEVPPGFVGTYKGDVDNAGNSLRKYLFNCNVPQVLRNDPTYPKVQWNACTATAKVWGSWDPVESKYYPLTDGIAPLGFEEIMIDVGWWQGAEPDTDPVDWPSGMNKAADYARQHGLRFGLYWTDNEDLTTPAGCQARAARIKRLFRDYGADMWRSDCTSGTVVAPDYWSVKGFYGIVDELQQAIPDFQWENCAGGGRIKDYGAMKRSVKIFNSDTYSALDVRKAFYDSSFAFNPIQIEGHLVTNDNSGTNRPQGKVGMTYAFRSMSMGAPEWVLDSPNSSMSKPWSDEEKQAVMSCVATYKTKIRPLVRSADLYHIFPRPDDHVWDGIEYYDPATGKGVVYLFKPDSPNDTHSVILKGLDARRMYRLTFEDGSHATASRSGADLMNIGIGVTLRGKNVSELMFFQALEKEIPR